MSSVNEIREAFLDYFKNVDHQLVSSSSLVPLNDPTLMFTNAGMVQFKNVFTGAERPGFERAVSSQKCVRAGGKHNDLDNVGYTARHHTFFEMLGNFSFGDYFKEEAIFYAWDLLTRTFEISKKRMLVTVYAEDQLAYELWQKISGLPESKILKISGSDNFWAMGETGPCGPCSEIFYDHGDQLQGGPPGSAGEDGDRYVEIWNLVFMQYEQVSKDERRDLPKPSIDTGMGLERIAALLQGSHDNYEINLFKALINASVEVTGVAARGEAKASHRVIADHLRATSFLIADGVLPSNEGRGYVLRRIMRRAMRHVELLGVHDPLIYRLVPTLVEEMGHAFPELTRAEALITETLKGEEERFRRTLDNGLKLLGKEVDKLGTGKTLAGDVAFKLYDTYGFPLDLTEDALRAKGLEVDKDGFNTAMEKQKAEARKSWSGSGDVATDSLWFDLKVDHGATEFLGYENEEAQGLVTAIIRDGKPVKSAKKSDEISLLLNQTPFYGESGGQMGDMGVLTTSDGAEIAIGDTQKPLGALHLHKGVVTRGKIAVGDTVTGKVDSDNRTRLRANHSATHLLHEALRRCLGDHVTQKGSLVAGDRLRFDFSHPKPMSRDELAAVEEDVNAHIRANSRVSTRLMTPEAAIEAGALALFGEKYGDEVRVVAMGEDGGDGPYSVELCGGTHVKRTGDIGLLVISGESAVAAGIRRIEALTGAAALAYLKASESQLQQSANLLKSSPDEVMNRVEGLMATRKKLEREVAELKKKLALGGEASGGAMVEDVGGIAFLGQRVEGVPVKDLRAMVDGGKAKLDSGVVAFVAVNEGKAALQVGVTSDLTDRYSAIELVKLGSKILGGQGGGGRPDMAQAGGPDGEQAEAALTAIREAIKKGA